MELGGAYGAVGCPLAWGCLWGAGVLPPPPPTHLLCAHSPTASCSWDRKNNPEPWNKLGPTDQYKVSSGMNWGGGEGSAGECSPSQLSALCSS